MAGLGAASAAVGSGLMVQSSAAGLTGANLFILAFAESGTGKGRAFDAMLSGYFAEARRRAEEWVTEQRPLIVADLEAAKADLERGKKERRDAKTDVDQATAVETLRSAARRLHEAEADLAREPVFNIGNATAEAICECLGNAPGESAAIFSADARDIVDNLLGRYSKDGKGSDEAIFLQSYSGDAVNIKRKGRPALSLRSPRLTLCLAVQPDIWQRLVADSRMMESGFLARALAFDSDAGAARPSDHVIPECVLREWHDTLAELFVFRDEPDPVRIVQPDSEARRLFNLAANSSADAREAGGVLSDVKPFAARFAENAWRLGLTLHAIQYGANSHRMPMDAFTARSAITLTHWFFTETMVLLAPLRRDKLIVRLEKLMQVFERRQVEHITMRELRNNHGFDPGQVRTLANRYTDRLSIVCPPPGVTGGRPSEIVVIGSMKALFETPPTKETAAVSLPSDVEEVGDDDGSPF
ncbi:MAG TPA: DUF3987 domain-containing protein [Verrucomicrobiales bacterium]|nr:DUF3987 domain-containing protein [Verrucomicrobiales bacterium]